jgi:hypothetical protein
MPALLTEDLCPLCKKQYLQFPKECTGYYSPGNKNRLFQAVNMDYLLFAASLIFFSVLSSVQITTSTTTGLVKASSGALPERPTRLMLCIQPAKQCRRLKSLELLKVLPLRSPFLPPNPRAAPLHLAELVLSAVRHQGIKTVCANFAKIVAERTMFSVVLPAITMSLLWKDIWRPKVSYPFLLNHAV